MKWLIFLVFIGCAHLESSPPPLLVNSFYSNCQYSYIEDRAKLYVDGVFSGMITIGHQSEDEELFFQLLDPFGGTIGKIKLTTDGIEYTGQMRRYEGLVRLENDWLVAGGHRLQLKRSEAGCLLSQKIPKSWQSSIVGWSKGKNLEVVYSVDSRDASLTLRDDKSGCVTLGSEKWWYFGFDDIQACWTVEKRRTIEMPRDLKLELESI